MLGRHNGGREWVMMGARKVSQEGVGPLVGPQYMGGEVWTSIQWSFHVQETFTIEKPEDYLPVILIMWSCIHGGPWMSGGRGRDVRAQSHSSLHTFCDYLLPTLSNIPMAPKTF